MSEQLCCHGRPAILATIPSFMRWCGKSGRRLHRVKGHQRWMCGAACRPKKERCKHGHLLAGSNVRRQFTEGYIKRRCVTCEKRNRHAYFIRRVRSHLASR